MWKQVIKKMASMSATFYNMKYSSRFKFVNAMEWMLNKTTLSWLEVLDVFLSQKSQKKFIFSRQDLLSLHLLQQYVMSNNSPVWSMICMTSVWKTISVVEVGTLNLHVLHHFARQRESCLRVFPYKWFLSGESFHFCTHQIIQINSFVYQIIGSENKNLVLLKCLTKCR